tara:strand:- start:483 stop:1415 length:933 start_codon:yes stop_codon:yes gene_type:complete
LSSDKKVLVTGGSGFIGSNLVDILVKNKYEVLVIDDLSSGLKENHNNKAKYLNLDLCSFIGNTKDLVKLLIKEEISTVFHLAASADVNLSINNPEKVYEINLISSISLYNSCKKANISKFIFASTSAVYGEPDYFPVDERHKTFPISPYGLSKLAFEQFLSYSFPSSNISNIIFRLPNVYGFRQRADLEGGVIAIFDEKMSNNEDVVIFGDGNQTRDWVNVDDIINAFYKSININYDLKIILLGSGKETSVNELFAVLSKEKKYLKNPVFKKKRKGDIKNMVMTNSLAKDLLDWSPQINLREGLKKLSDR